MRKFRFMLLLSVVAITCAAGRANAIQIDSINAAIGVMDFDVPSSFTFDFVDTTGPLVGIFESVLTLSGELIDGGRDGVSAAPFSNVAIAQALIEGTGIIDLGPAVFTAGAYGPYTLPTLIDSADFGGTIDAFSLRISFTASGGDDQYSFNASHVIQAVSDRVPAPASLALLGLGLLILGWSMRR